MTVKITNLTELLNHFKNDSGIIKTDKDLKNLKKFLQDDKFIAFFESTVTQSDKKKKPTEDKEDESEALVEAYKNMVESNPETNFKEDSTVGTSIVGNVGCMWYLKTGKNNSCCGKIEKNYYFLKNEIPLCEPCSKKKTVNKLVSLLGKTVEKKSTPKAVKSTSSSKKSTPKAEDKDKKKSDDEDKKKKKSLVTSDDEKDKKKSDDEKDKKKVVPKKEEKKKKSLVSSDDEKDKKKKKKSLISSDDEEDATSEDKSSVKKTKKESSSSSDSDSSSTFRIK